MTQKVKAALLVLSGGMDSVTMLYEFRNEIALAVNFHYGSNHNERETECARYHCGKLGIELLELNLEFMGEYFHSSLLDGPEAVPEGHYTDDNMRSTVVPFRNGIMLSVAAGIAESNGLNKLLIANHSGDHAIYPDCRRSFIDAMAQAIQQGTYEDIRLEAPYCSLSKSEIAAKGKILGIDYSKTYSCYRGQKNHCGTCGTCVERKEALRDAGIDDTTVYEN